MHDALQKEAVSSQRKSSTERGTTAGEVETYEDLCDGTEVVVELVVSVDDGATDKNLWLGHCGGHVV